MKQNTNPKSTNPQTGHIREEQTENRTELLHDGNEQKGGHGFNNQVQDRGKQLHHYQGGNSGSKTHINKNLINSKIKQGIQTKTKIIF